MKERDNSQLTFGNGFICFLKIISNPNHVGFFFNSPSETLATYVTFEKHGSSVILFRDTRS